MIVVDAEFEACQLVSLHATSARTQNDLLLLAIAHAVHEVVRQEFEVLRQCVVLRLQYIRASLQGWIGKKGKKITVLLNEFHFFAFTKQ